MKKLPTLFLLSVLFMITAFSATITAVRVPTAIADGGGPSAIGYPYAVFVQISGWTACASTQAFLKIYSGSTVEYMWSASSSWNNTNQYTVSSPIVNIDASGNWSGWIYAKHNTAIVAAPAVRAAKVGTTGTNLTSATIPFTILNMSTTGGWLVASSSSAANRGVVAYSGTTSVGSYRTENNGITEGYSYSSGGFKIAVPAGLVDSVVFYNDDGSYYSSIVGPWSITANTETNTINVISVASGKASLTPSLWKYNVPTTFQIVFKPTTDTVQNIRIARPSVLNWNVSNVILTPNIGTVTSIADTIQISGVNLKSTDSLAITISNVTAEDTTATISVLIKTSKDAVVYGQISTLPQTFVYGSPRPMNLVKAKDGAGLPLLNGKYVVVKGIVTVANEFGIPAYVQDTTAGIAVYDSSVSLNVNRGDEVVLLGVVSPYSGMFELNPCSILETVSEGNPVDTALVTIPQINNQNQNGVEPYECRLVRVNNIDSVLTESNSRATSWAVSGSGTTYFLFSGTDMVKVFVKPVNTIANMATPSGKFDVVGVLGQYFTTYELLPRTIDDIIVEGGGPRITSGVPYESNLTATSVTFHWLTDAPGSSIVNYGVTTAYSSSVADTNKVRQHTVIVSGLIPASVYHIQLGSANTAGGVTYTNDYLVSTSSQSSTGVINVYFNHSVNTALARGENAQTVGIASKLLMRINAAVYSIDAALYSLSGDTGASIANALIAAKDRGVKVRVIGEYDNHTTAPWSTLSNNGITVVFDNYDATNAGVGLMHNKFVVIDNRDTTSDTDDWVWTGSCNMTNPGTADDAQNAIEIQDKALANAYTIEFNEMWGSNTDTPNAATSRFGARKLNNTPHYFKVNGTPIELYFSPSDGTSGQIIKTLNKAKESVDFCILSFTYSATANALTNLFHSGIKVRGVIDNNTDSGEQYDSLVARGLDVHLKAMTGLLHHKYAIIDANGADTNKYVITGSHNWSGAAETKNNENTLIIRSARIANLYLQEFSPRYTDAGGSAVPLGVTEKSSTIPQAFSISQNYPNPFNPSTNFEFSLPKAGMVSIKVYDILGREIITLLNEVKSAGVYQVTWNASTLPSGVYFYRVQAGNSTAVKKAMLLK